LQSGKIPIALLERTVLRMTGAQSGALITGPKAGVDFAAIRTSGGYMIVSSDPVTGVSDGIGDYAVNVSANDVATSGNAPQFMGVVILLPEKSTPSKLEAIASDMNAAAKTLGVTIVGGHTEVTPGLARPIVSVTAFILVKRFVTSEHAREGDAILMTKTAGLEGTSVLASGGGRLPVGLAARARKLRNRLGVVKEAVRAFETGYVHAMHDCTEGGILGAVYEMSLASGRGFELWERKVPVAEETREVCRRLSLDPLKLIGSGSLLIAVPRRGKEHVRHALRGVSQVTEVGSFTRKGRFLVKRDGGMSEVRATPVDELWRALAASA
jgi:hydrogenase maturation factor